ncbi:MAG: hypothetical protein H0V27_02025 [Pyrinomonadaceae bacterium]|nr:hypothetical protein [Pyrinomonadaceae bacterium]
MLEDEERVKKMLRRAVRTEVASPALRAKIQERIRAKHTFNFFPLTKGRAAIAACLLVALGLGAWIVGASFERGETANAIVSSESNLTLSDGTKRILNIGLGDHLHCAVDNRFTVGHLGFLFRDLETQHAGLRHLIAEKMGDAYKIIGAHRCEDGGREFDHIILRREEAIISLVVTAKRDDESFASEPGAPQLQAAGAALYAGQTNGYTVTGFESRDHLAFIASNLPANENLRLAASVAPFVRDYLARSETASASAKRRT